MMLGSALLYYFSFREKLKNSAVYMLLFVSIFLVSGTFFNFNSGSWSANALISENSPEQIRVRDKKKAPPPAKDKKTTVKKRKRYPKPKRAGINREYNNGFFRVPHVANYFLGLLTLFLGYRLFNQRKWLDAILFVTALSLMVYTGVRTFIIAFALASVIFLLRKKTKYVALGLIVMAALIIIFRYELHHLLGDNIIGSYSFMLINLIDNPEGVTRFAMIKSWWHELPEFSFWELMFGKGFTHSVVFNTRQNNLETWFHNDYTSISYAYGLLGTLAYIGLYAFIFVRFRKIIRANYFIFVYFLSIIFMAAITGFYFFYPALLMFPFVLMVNEESNKGAHIKSHNS
jgi:hypothetical protein